MNPPAAPWYRVANPDDVASPALLVFPDRVAWNIARMLALAGGPDRLFPHVKTHKLPEIVRLQQAAGIQKFKCATIAEAEMLGQCGATRVLLAYQPVGPNIDRLLTLTQRFPATRFSAIVDHEPIARAIAAAAQARGITLELLVDLDTGMHRTGIEPGAGARELYRLLAALPGIVPGGLHAYDGHIHDPDPEVRRRQVQVSFAPVEALRAELVRENLPVPRVVAGGTPTFPLHAANPAVDCSPGTCLLMDFSYDALMPQARFQLAAVLLCRVISKPGTNRLCVDLGHKAIAAENPPPRVQFLELPDAVAVGHSEEHLVLETPRAAEFHLGDVLYGVPRHICPTVALHDSVTVVRAGRADARWKVLARDRRLSV
jgi:D-threonine aldolase